MTRLDRFGYWPLIPLIPLAVMSLALVLAFQWRGSQLKAPVPDSRLRGYSPGELRGVFDAWGAEGCRFYARTQVYLDIAFPLCYGLFFVILLRQVGRGSWYWTVPVWMIMADMLENTLLIKLALAHAGGQPWSDWLARTASCVTVLKWLLFPAICLLIVICLIRTRLGPRPAAGKSPSHPRERTG